MLLTAALKSNKSSAITQKRGITASVQLLVMQDCNGSVMLTAISYTRMNTDYA